MALGDPYINDLDLAAFLKMTVTTNDAYLTKAAKAASRWVEGYCRRQFNLAGSATARHFDASPDGTVQVDDIGNAVITVATDTARDGTYATAWASSDFQAAPLDALAQGRPVNHLVAVGSLLFAQPVDGRLGMVKVTAKWGWPAVPDEVIEACLIQGARVYKRRESAEGVLGFGEFGPVRIGGRVDPDVEELLASVRYAAGSF